LRRLLRSTNQTSNFKEFIQMKTIKIAFAAALVAATSSAAFAQGYYPNPVSVRAQQHRNVYLQSAPVQQRNVALPSESTQGNSAGPIWYGGSGPTSGGM
jgi:hypothetical protein